MADVFWIGAQIARPRVGVIDISVADPGDTFTVNVGGVREVTITAANGTEADVVAQLLATVLAEESGEFRELTFEEGDATDEILVTGPEDGAPFTLTVSTVGGTIAFTETVAPLSPHDVADGANYSGGVIPGASDRLVLQDSDVALQYNLDALVNAITVLRLPTFTGGVGLPDQNAGGYREYRRTLLDVDATAVTVELGPNDRAGQFRFEVTSASACTFTVRGPGSSARFGEEVVEFFGTIVNSVLNVTGGSVAACPEVGQTGVVTTARGANSTVRFGPGCTLVTPTLSDCQARIDCTYTTLAFNGGQVEVWGAAAGTTTTIDGGRLVWRSTGSPGTIEAGTDAYIDFTQAPATVAVSGTQKLHKGSTWDDRYGRVVTSYTIQPQRCDLNEVSIFVGNHKSLAVS